ncbi:MAG TPA: response regulator transcription factor [Bacteroidetes bacterium]|nr:response regulator transcription factor [Bacteroidota bacterium]
MNKQQHVKIFIADDHPVIAHGISCMLAKQANMKIVGNALSGKEMFQLLPKARPTILLLDLNMPGTDFYQNIAWVKKNSPWVKIIIFSGYYSPELVKSLIQEGASGYVAKTSKPAELIEAINSILSGKTFVAPPANAQSDNCQNPQQNGLSDDFRKRLSLSRREHQVLELISKGFSSLNIGKTLYISKHTVETHRKNILRKLDFNTSTELVKFAVQQGLVQ